MVFHDDDGGGRVLECAVDDAHDDEAGDEELEVGNAVDVGDILADAEAEDREVEEV